ncbi:helix-turn-helix domain-containing protein [Corynebacterium propinquum]|uniref:helix-turn-helix domain-containing protein n=1 Tax=Corynebacterium propinquum TaxID=43769 RepID=UPI00345E81B5
MDNWAQIRVLHAQGMSIRKIAAEVGCAKNLFKQVNELLALRFAQRTSCSHKKCSSLVGN